MKINKYHFAILLLFLGLFTFQFSMILSYAFQIFFLLLFFPWIISNVDKALLNKYNLYFGLFVLLTTFSILWAPNRNFAISAVVAIIQIFLYSSLVFNRLKCEEDFDKIFFYLGTTIFLCGIFILLMTSPREWQQIFMTSTNASSSQGRLGPSIAMHPNELAELLLYGSTIYFFLFLVSKRKRYLAVFSFLVTLLFFTKSRTSLVLMLFSLILLFVLNLRKGGKIVLVIPAIILAIVGVIWLIQNNIYLYNLVGFRFAGLFNPTGVIDASTRVRNEMVSNAIQLFKEHPFLGVGINNFRYYAVSRFNLFAEVYAHNNYVELLATTGILGFAAYYFPLLYTFVASLKEVLKNIGKVKPMYFLVLTLVTVRLLGDISRVSYSLEVAQMVNMLCFSWVYYNRGGTDSVKRINSIGFIQNNGK